MARTEIAVTAVRREGQALLSPLATKVEDLEIKTAEDYLTADELLTTVRQARRKWALKTSAVIDPQKESVRLAKVALDAAMALHREVDDPLAAMETGIKDEMKAFKVEEQRQLQAAQAERDREAERLRLDAEKKRQAAVKATTAPMRNRLQQQSEQLKGQALAVEEEAPQRAPIKAAGSSSRTTKRYRVKTPTAFFKALVSGDMDAAVVDISDYKLQQFFKTHPEVDPASVGCESYSDVVIVGR